MTTKKISKDSFIQANWRPLIAFVYMIILLFDFVVGPIFWSLLQAIMGADTLVSWKPLTLEAGGLVHVSLGSVLGISAFTRGKEKITRLENNFVQEKEPT